MFGLSVTSSWGNGHATFWRALCRALGRQGHRVDFFERDQWFYRSHRDLDELPGHGLHVYSDWAAIRDAGRAATRHADASVVTSYCADARDAAELVLCEARGLRVFYDMDTPVTLERLNRGEPVEYLPDQGLGDFDLVLSYSGGPSLAALETTLGARVALPLYGCVEPAEYPVHRTTPHLDLTYLGTYAEDRERAFRTLLLEPAGSAPERRFRVGGPQFPDPHTWPANVEYQPHVGQPNHLEFYGSGRFTLNLTRGAMFRWGHCPSGRLFEAAACGTPLITDDWPGLDDFFDRTDEVLVVRNGADVIGALDADERTRNALARRARARVLDRCTADVRVSDLERALETGRRPVLHRAAAGGARR